jgi:hypothetical protein
MDDTSKLITQESMLNKWDYSGVADVRYSDDNAESYKKAAEFLGDSVEDWGCGTGYARFFFKDYRGIDGSPSKNIPKENIVDLREYTSSVDNILIRQVLECTEDWKVVLENAKKSFKKKLCLVIMTHFSKEENLMVRESVIRADSTVEKDRYIDMVSFKKQDILDFFPEKEFRLKEEIIYTETGYGQDWVLYVERITR